MPKVEKISRVVCKKVSEEAMKALEEVANQFGLKVDRGRGSFDEAEFTFKVTFKAPGKAEEKAKSEFEQLAPLLDCDPKWFGQSFKDRGGKTMTVTGLNTKAPKNCIELTDENGGSYKCPPGYVRQHLGK